jgi:hypothetical protein
MSWSVPCPWRPSPQQLSQLAQLRREEQGPRGARPSPSTDQTTSHSKVSFFKHIVREGLLSDDVLQEIARTKGQMNCRKLASLDSLPQNSLLASPPPPHPQRRRSAGSRKRKKRSFTAISAPPPLTISTWKRKKRRKRRQPLQLHIPPPS